MNWSGQTVCMTGHCVSPLPPQRVGVSGQIVSPGNPNPHDVCTGGHSV